MSEMSIQVYTHTHAQMAKNKMHYKINLLTIHAYKWIKANWPMLLYAQSNKWLGNMLA